MKPAYIPPPNYTQIPNELIALIPDMGEAELKVTLAIARNTFGWHKQADKISYSQLMTLTGLSRQGVANGIDAGLERGTIVREPSGDSFIYSILVYEIDQTSLPSRPEVVNEVDTQKKERKNKESHAAADATPSHDAPNPFETWESIGLQLSPYIAERLGEFIQDYTTPWVNEAIRRAARVNKRNIAYVEGILKRWLAAGGMDGPPEKDAAPEEQPPLENVPAVDMSRVVIR